MDSSCTDFHFVNTVNSLILHVDELDFEKDSLVTWGKEVDHTLKRLGVHQIPVGRSLLEHLEPIEKLLWSLNDKDVSLVDRYFGTRGFEDAPILASIIARFVIRSTIAYEVEEMVSGTFQLLKSMDEGSEIPGSGSRRLLGLYNRHVEQTAARRRDEEMERKAKKVAWRKKKCDEVKREHAMHKQEAKRLAQVLEALERRMNDSDMKAEEDRGMEDDEEEGDEEGVYEEEGDDENVHKEQDSLMGEDEMDDSDTEDSD